jgi:DNA repair photolyase
MSMLIKGRGAQENTPNRFQSLNVVYEPQEPEAGDDTTPAKRTKFYQDKAKSILSKVDSPDIHFQYSLNAYRGCEHGCSYCYARPSHEYLGFSAGLDFETKIMVKADAAALLRKQLMHPKWEGTPITLSGNTDCYQPVERKLQITRQILQVCAEFSQPVGIITKNALVRRDIDLLAQLAKVSAAQVFLSITTLDDTLSGALEPRASRPRLRLDAVKALSDAGVPCGVIVAPVIAGLNDRDVPAVLEAAKEAGARTASWTLLRLAKPLDTLFEDWLRTHFPDRAEKVLSRIRDCRGGALNDTRFDIRMRGEGVYAEQLASLFDVSAKRLGLDARLPAMNPGAFCRPAAPEPFMKQLTLNF